MGSAKRRGRGHGKKCMYGRGGVNERVKEKEKGYREVK